MLTTAIPSGVTAPIPRNHQKNADTATYVPAIIILMLLLSLILMLMVYIYLKFKRK